MAENLKNLSVLVVDDEALVLQTVSFILKRFGFTVAEARNGRQALSMLKTKHIDLVVTDFWMPEINGLELAIAVKQLQPRLPVIMMSAMAPQFQMQPALTGVDRLLTKPFEIDDLRTAVKAVMHPAVTT